MFLGISPIKTNKPTFKPANAQISFGGNNLFKQSLITSYDFFQRSEPAVSIEPLDKIVTRISEKINSQLKAFTPEQLNTAIKNVMREVPNTSEQETLIVMQKLTQWANYRCLPVIEKKLSNLDVSNIEAKTPLNKCFNYFHAEKRLIQLNQDSKNIACFVTPRELDSILKKKTSANVFINLEGFDDGVNLLSDDNKLQECTIKTLLKVKNLLREKPQRTFREGLFSVLNGKIKKRMNDYGYTVKTIQVNNPPTRESILSQMAPYSPPSTNDVRKTIEAIAHFYTNDKQEYNTLSNNIAQYYESRLEIYSKQKLIHGLDEIKKLIDKFIKENKISEDNVYYIIPDELGLDKSYGLITEMFARQHNIPPEKIHRIGNILELNDYSPKTTFVILDDFAGSGDSMSNAANYNFDKFCLLNDRHVIFSPITVFKYGLENIEANIESAGRENLDYIITLKENIQPSLYDKKNIKIDEYFFLNELGQKVLGFEGYRSDINFFTGCTVFPYMSPDNNSDLASFITRFFLPKSKGIK